MWFWPRLLWQARRSSALRKSSSDAQRLHVQRDGPAVASALPCGGDALYTRSSCLCLCLVMCCAELTPAAPTAADRPGRSRRCLTGLLYRKAANLWPLPALLLPPVELLLGTPPFVAVPGGGTETAARSGRFSPCPCSDQHRHPHINHRCLGPLLSLPSTTHNAHPLFLHRRW